MANRRERMMRHLEQGVREHIEIETQDNIGRGMSADEARRAAMLKFGSIRQITEDTREVWSWVWLEQFAQDIRYGMRTLRRAPGFTAVAVLTLALGIGANTAIFSAVNGILLHRLPYPHSEQLGELWVIKDFRAPDGTNLMVSSNLPPLKWREVRDQLPAISQLALWWPEKFLLTGGTAPVSVGGARVSSDFFTLLGVRPISGRILTAGDTTEGVDRVVVLSYALWQELAGGAVIEGRKITLDGKAYTVIGVMPRDFDYSMAGQRDQKALWMPLVQTIEGVADEKNSDLGVNAIVRLQKGVSIQSFNAQLKIVAPRVSDHWSAFLHGANLEARDLKPDFGDIETGLMILMGAVTFVLLIACVNVSALLLGRSFGRQREIALRETLGAGRPRIVRQFLTESLLLAGAGGCAGVICAIWGVRALQLIAPVDTMGVNYVQIDARVLWFTLGLSLLTGIFFGMAPALQASTRRSGLALNETLAGSVSRYQKGSRRLRGALVVFEIALAVILVVGATLVARSFEKLASADLGFRTDHLLTMSTTFSPGVCDAAKMENADRCVAAANEILRRLHGMPGVEAAASVSNLPLKEGTAALSLIVEGSKDVQQGVQGGNLVGERHVSPDYFQAIGLRVLGGRNFNDTDTKNASLVAIVNQAFARRFFDGNAVGRRFADGDRKEKDGSPLWVQVVGVVNDSHDDLHRFESEAQAHAEFYLPLGQPYFPGSQYLMVRTKIEPLAMAAAIRQQIWAVDKDAPIEEMKTMDAVVSESVAAPRFRTLLLGAFGTLGLFLAMIGIYGVISYAVTQRTQEIGLRVAMGAQPRDVLRLMLGEGMFLAAIGIVVGIAGALALTRILQSLLYEIKPRDPLTFIGVAVVVAATAAAACYIPARRATRVDPMVALRYE